jgi:hypothetical protein
MRLSGLMVSSAGCVPHFPSWKPSGTLALLASPPPHDTCAYGLRITHAENLILSLNEVCHAY